MNTVQWTRTDADNGWTTGGVYMNANSTGMYETDEPYFVATIFDASEGQGHEVEIEFNENAWDMPATVYSGRALSLPIAVGVVLALIGEAILAEHGLRPNPFDVDGEVAADDAICLAGAPVTADEWAQPRVLHLDEHQPTCTFEWTEMGDNHVCGNTATHAAEIEFTYVGETTHVVIYACTDHGGKTIVGESVKVVQNWTPLETFKPVH